MKLLIVRELPVQDLLSHPHQAGLAVEPGRMCSSVQLEEGSLLKMRVRVSSEAASNSARVWRKGACPAYPGKRSPLITRNKAGTHVDWAVTWFRDQG